jgi:hypothetical protein
MIKPEAAVEPAPAILSAGVMFALRTTELDILHIYALLTVCMLTCET